MKAVFDNLIYTTNDECFVWHINNGLSEPYPRELNIVKKYLEKFPNRNNTFIDVGGHIGTTSLPYSRLFKNVIAYEPNIESYNFFVKNLELNNNSNIKVYNKGVYNKSTNCTVVMHGSNSGCFYIKECDKNIPNSIEVIRLDDMDYQDSVDFIKIDTEGSELHVLEGAYNLIKKYKPLVQVETNIC